MTVFLERKWATDKNNAIQSEYDLYLLDQLPEHVQIDIFSRFLFGDFLK